MIMKLQGTYTYSGVWILFPSEKKKKKKSLKRWRDPRWRRTLATLQVQRFSFFSSLLSRKGRSRERGEGGGGDVKNESPALKRPTGAESCENHIGPRIRATGISDSSRAQSLYVKYAEERLITLEPLPPSPRAYFPLPRPTPSLFGHSDKAVRPPVLRSPDIKTN